MVLGARRVCNEQGYQRGISRVKEQEFQALTYSRNTQLMALPAVLITRTSDTFACEFSTARAQPHKR